MEPSPRAASLRTGSVTLLLAVLGTFLPWGGGAGFLTVLGAAGGAAILLGWVAWRERRRGLLAASVVVLAMVALRAWFMWQRMFPPRYADYFPSEQPSPLASWLMMNGAAIWFGSTAILVIAAALAFLWSARAAVGRPEHRLRRPSRDLGGS
ncbi:hypothetical protein [Galactobacter valiniphilus]|uniref:hypothetical protein n=1 Tax=Galactobacter valiniphilus TaxID=2676122 RepID=UPI0037358CF7